MRGINVVIIGYGNIAEWILDKLTTRAINNEIVVNKISFIDNNVDKMESKVSDQCQNLLVSYMNNSDPRILELINSVNYGDSYAPIDDADYIILSYGAKMDASVSSREDLLWKNDSILTDITNKIKNHNYNTAKFINIANPLDVISWRLKEKLNLDPQNILGVSGMVDVTRFAQALHEVMSVDYSSIDFSSLFVFGEHGNSMVPMLSQVKIDGKNIKPTTSDECAEKINNYAVRKGSSMMKNNNMIPAHITIASSVVDTILAWESDTKTRICASVWDDCLEIFTGTLLDISKSGLSLTQLPSDSSEDETIRLTHSHTIIRKMYDQLSVN